MKMLNRDEGFNLFSIIRSARQRRPVGAFTEYSGKDLNVNMEALGYYALSTFWRGSVHHWKTPTGITGVELGKYQEPIRRYLLGLIGMPQSIVLRLIVATDWATQNTSMFPHEGERATDRSVFSFVARGLVFDLIVWGSSTT
jgi:hypothetical protein